MFTAENDELLDQLWVEKYRPKNINDIVLENDQKQFLIKCLEKQEICHLGLFGPPGSGKTTLARIVDTLCKNEMDVLRLNGSDSTGVDSMRTTVAGFLKSPPYQSKTKIVYIDEFDYTTQNAQAILRNMMENYCDTGRFIVTGNYISKIMDPLLSRFTVFEMKTLSKEFVINHVKTILDKENIKYNIETIDLIVQNFIPDVRKIINTIQKNIVKNQLIKIDVSKIITIEKKICGLIIQICDDISGPNKETTINQNAPQILELLSGGSEPDYRQIYQTLFFHEKLPIWAKIKVNQYQNNHGSCALPSAHFMAMIFDIFHAGIIFYSMFKKKG